MDDLVAAHDLVGVVDIGVKFAVGFTEENDVPVRVGDEDAARDVVEHALVELDFFEKFLDVGRFQRSLLLMGKPAVKIVCKNSESMMAPGHPIVKQVYNVFSFDKSRPIHYFESA